MPFFLSIVKDVQISPFYALTIKGETHIFWGIFCVSHYKNILDIRKIAPSNSILQDGVGDFSGNFFDLNEPHFKEVIFPNEAVTNFLDETMNEIGIV